MCLDTEGCASNYHLSRSKLLFEAKKPFRYLGMAFLFESNRRWIKKDAKGG